MTPAISVTAPRAGAADGAQQAEAAISTPTWVKQIGRAGRAFVYPWGMATAIDGTILTSDYNNYNIKRFSPDGGHLQTFGSSARFNQPYQLAVDPTDGDIFLADTVNGEIDKFDKNGVFEYSFKPQAPTDPSVGPYIYVARLAVNSAGWLYLVSSHNVTSTWPHRVLVFKDPDQQNVEPDIIFGGNGAGAGQFNVARGIGVDANDNVYIADNGNRRIQVFSRDGVFLRSFGSGGTGAGKFGYDLRGVAVDKDNGWVYVMDASQGHVEKFTLSGASRGVVGAPGEQPGEIGGGRELTVGLDHSLYVADYTYWRINKYDAAGNFVADIPFPPVPPPQGGFNQATHVAVDPQPVAQGGGAVYVSDTFNHRIQKFTPVVLSGGSYSGGTFSKMWGHRALGAPDAMNYPRGVAIDPANGNVWLNNTRTGDIKAYTSEGAFIRSFGTQGSEDDQFFYAQGIAVDPNGRVLVPDSANARLKVIDQFGNNLVTPIPCGKRPPPGQVTLLMGCTGVAQENGRIYAASPQEHVVLRWDSAGNPLPPLGTLNTPGSADGRLNLPSDVAIFGDRVYVSEVGNNRISVFDLNGSFQGRWGSAGSAHGQFRGPRGIAVDRDGLIYVMDTGNSRVEVFRP